MLNSTPRFVVWLLLVFVCSGGVEWITNAESALSQPIRFGRDIRPLLSENCYHCHGPDEGNRKADLRLDHAEGAKEDRGGYRAVVPGDPEESELIKRISTDDPDDLMPPPESGKHLSPEDKRLLRRWIDQGAEFESHWSFVPPVRPVVPAVHQTNWTRQSMDAFILRKLENAGLGPAPEASKETLIRRVTLDLTGLPPTPEEVEMFLQDSSDGAYARVVDRLLESERYGERMALGGLNAARYADTNGYQNDKERQMWVWRNWVIDAYNQNKPFDEFTIEQLAGDMLPNASIEQKIASAFNRNHRINGEGGVIPEEYRVEYVIDRLETTGTIWLGLTVGCARCHSHKFDPISQREFYSLFSYFNNVPENGRDGNKGNAEPILTVPVPGTEAKRRMAEQRIQELKAAQQSVSPEFLNEFEEWVEDVRRDLREGKRSSMWQAATVLNAHSTGDVTFQSLADGSFLSSGGNPSNPTYTIKIRPGTGLVTGIRLETLTHPSLTNGGLARSVNGNFVLTEFEIEQGETVSGKATRLAIASAMAGYSQRNYPINLSIDGKSGSGWAVFGRPKMLDTSAVFTLAEPLNTSKETVLTVRMRHDGSFNRHAVGRFRFSLSSSTDPALEGESGLPSNVIAALGVPNGAIGDEERLVLIDYFRQIAPVLAPLRSQVREAESVLARLEKTASTSVMVMSEMPERRPAFILNRGQYDQPGEEVFPAIPVSLGQLPAGAPNNRLGLAQWLVSSDNPLTARVTVNRYWQMLFGTGLVESVDDFGAQGAYPSHPELLDWLATEFVRSGWDIKSLLRLIVTSATYRQSSVLTSESYARDPENRLLARGPRFRLAGETIRDQALAVSGLLEPVIGGPSVKPYQPAGLWEEVAYDKKMRYTRGSGEDLYRRSMYTFWKRAVAPPSMILFDSSGRERCDVSRRATNTPLQALVTLNDVQFVEAARLFAGRMMREGGDQMVDRLRYGWRLVLARFPDAVELETLTRGYRMHLNHYQQHPQAVADLAAIGETSSSRQGSAELAAYTAIANMILNLDETVTRE